MKPTSSLSVKDFLALIPPTAAAAGFVYVTYLAFCPQASCPGRVRAKTRVNQKVKLETDKVADLVDIEVSSIVLKHAYVTSSAKRENCKAFTEIKV